MKSVGLALLTILALLATACIVEEPTQRPTREDRQGIDPTLEARIEAARQADAAIKATIEARMATPLSAPGGTEPPRPNATPLPGSTVPPSATPLPGPTIPPSATPLPGPTIPPSATPLPGPTFYPTAIPLPFLPTPTPLPTLSPLEILSLTKYADRYAGGPGAIYVGDLGQLAGPAVTEEYMPSHGTIMGDDNGQVPLYALEQHLWIYETDYYQSLLERARLTDPTQLVSRGERISLQHTCINRLLLWCQMLEANFVPNVTARTNRQVHIDVSSFPELGIAGPDTTYLIADGTLDMTEIYGGYVGAEYPQMSLQYLWGLWPDHQTHFAIQTSIAPELDRVVAGEMNSQVLMRNWIAADDQYIFSDLHLNSPADFRGLRTRSHSTELSDWLGGIGASAQFVAFAEAYTAMERGILDAAVTGGNPALDQRWHEVTEYMNGPITNFNSTIIAINDQVWDSIPGDLQQILLEEGAKFELEVLRLAAIQNITPLQRNLEAGMEYAEFSTEIRTLGFESAIESVIPGWIERLGYPGSGHETVETFNEHVGPYVGLYIDENGSAVRTGITAGPHAGKTMEQVLAE